MAGRGTCRGQGAHRCEDPSSHLAEFTWMAPVGYVAHVAGSPSALPPRHSAVARHVAALRGLPAREMHAEADRHHASLWAEFKARRDEALAALPAGARAGAGLALRRAHAMGHIGLHDGANELYRRVYRELGVEEGARGLEELAGGYTAAAAERIAGGLLDGGALKLFRLAGYGERDSAAASGILEHNAGKDHLSFSLYLVERYEERPVLLLLRLTGNVMDRLRALRYVSAAYSAPGSLPVFPEVWDGAKSWEMARECEVRLRTPVKMRGLGLTVYTREPPGEGALRSLRGLCGRRGVIVPASWPPDL